MLDENTEECSLCIVGQGQRSPVWRELFPSDLSSDVLWQGQTISIVLDTAPLVRGHLLIISRDHETSFSSVSIETRRELNQAMERVKHIFSKKYRPPTLFEHGSTGGVSRGGACIDHAHLHVVPGFYDLVPLIRQDFPALKEYSSMSDAFAELNGKPYILVSEPDHMVCATEADICPNQYLRSVVSKAAGAADRWHWQDCLLFSDLWGITDDVQSARNELSQEFIDLSK